MKLSDYRRIWRKHGGDQHGPRIETWTIPEENFAAFMREAVEAANKQKEGKSDG